MRPPAVGRLLDRPEVAALVVEHGRQAVAEQLRLAVESLRSNPDQAGPDPSPEAVEVWVAGQVAGHMSRAPRRLHRVINGTGVVIHTNLGRAPLGEGIARHAAEVSAGYSNLELDRASGRRGDRQDLISDLLAHLSGAEAAMVVNNAAAAVLLGLTAIGRGREVIVSRGEAIEIGGGFRIPDILRLSGARLVEVGTTNRTRVEDYAQATHAATAAYLRVHQSNFRMDGFVARPVLRELTSAAHAIGIPVLEDVGSGLIPRGPDAVRAEDRLRGSISDGVDLLFCSGDKLVGASQAGLIMGGKQLVGRLRRHPLARALRPDKLQLAALEGTLLCYESPERLEEIPVWWMLGRSSDELRHQSERWAVNLGAAGCRVEVVPMSGAVGGGTTPGPELPSFGILLRVPKVAAARRKLISGDPAVLALEWEAGLAIDARCVLPADEAPLLGALAAAFGGSR